LDGFALPVKKLKGTDPVETLDLSGKNLGVASAVVIASLISVNGGLTKLSIAKNKLGHEGTKTICEALEQNKTLKELDISGEMFGKSNIGGTAGVKHVAKMLGVNGGLTSLDLSNNLLCGVNQMASGTYTAEGITAIAEALRVNGALTALNLSSNRLKDEGVSAVCEAIHSNKETKLALLNIENNGIGPVGVNAVAAMVVVTGSLTKIDVSCNSFGPEGAKVFADALRVNGALTEVR